MKTFVSTLKKARLLRQQGNFNSAETLLRELLSKKPDQIDVLYELAALKTELRGFSEAYYFVSLILEQDPRSVPALQLLGHIQSETDSLEASLDSYSQALNIQPNNPEILFSRGVVLRGLGRQQEAKEDYAAALKLVPQQAEAWCNYGNILFDLKQFDEALRSYEEGIKHASQASLLHFNRGNTLKELGRLDEALQANQRALELDPGNPAIVTERGWILLLMGKSDEAISEFQLVTNTVPQDPRAYNKLGAAFKVTGRYHESIECYDKAIALDPYFWDARTNRTLSQLYIHNFAEAWPEYEFRLNLSQLNIVVRNDPQLLEAFRTKPHWKGVIDKPSGVVGIWDEQGMGDKILYATLLPELINTGQSFVYEMQERLIPAYQRTYPGQQFVALATPPDRALMEADSMLFAGSLPGLFRTSLASFERQPTQTLEADPGRVAHYAGVLGGKFKVGISWGSTRSDHEGRKKSAALKDFAPLLTLPDIEFVDVQYGDTLREREELMQQHGIKMTRFEEVDYYNDLEEMLAILEACDLLITTSNFNAHMAGALGKPVWLLYPSDLAPFHYWAHRGDYRSLWYPSVEIISGPTLTDWGALIQHTKEKLIKKLLN